MITFKKSSIPVLGYGKQLEVVKYLDSVSIQIE